MNEERRVALSPPPFVRATFALVLAAVCSGCGSSGESTSMMTMVGVSDAAPVTTCSASFTGAVSVASGTCTVQATYDPSTATSAFQLTGTLSGSTDTWNGVTIGFDGMLVPQTYDATDFDSAVESLSSDSDFWIAGGGTSGTSSPTFGPITITITSATLPEDDDGGITPYTLHGAIQATLKDQNTDAPMPDVMMTATF